MKIPARAWLTHLKTSGAFPKIFLLGDPSLRFSIHTGGYLGPGVRNAGAFHFHALWSRSSFFAQIVGRCEVHRLDAQNVNCGKLARA
jgi:hypothetical protein